MSEIEDFKTVDQLKKELLSLTRENFAAMQTITKLLKELNLKNEKIASLESLINQTVPVAAPKQNDPKKIQLQVTPEQEIADIQLERLRQSAKNRSLTLEETRMYDLLVKNKRLSQDESTVNLAKGEYRDVKEVELLKIASAPDETEQ